MSMIVLHGIIGNSLSSMLKAIANEMKQKREFEKDKNSKNENSICENDVDVEKSHKNLSFAKESCAFAEGIGDEDWAKLKLSEFLKPEE